MPKNKEALIRYRIIDKCLRNKFRPFPTMYDLIDELEDKLGTTFSKSTVQKDIKAMKEDEALGYLAPIVFSRIKMGYHYSDPNYTIASVPLNEGDIGAVDFATLVLEQLRGIPIIDQYGQAVDKIMESVNMRQALEHSYERTLIQFEQVAFQEGVHLIGPLIEAIRNRQVVEFDYKRFDIAEPKHHKVHPYLLKEYRNRWYLIGMLDKKERILTYGLDRINNLCVCSDEFSLHPDFDAEKYFQHTFGITTFGNPEIVELSFTPLQGKYLKSQPLHHTQKIILDTEKEFRIAIHVIVSPELKMSILSFGESVKVLRPASLVDEIRQLLEKTLNKYN